MAGPSKEEIRVATDALRSEAVIWGNESTACTNLAGVVDGLNMSTLEGGLLYGIYVHTYQEVCELISSVLRGGGTAMHDISATLEASGNLYDEEEANNVHLAQGKW